VPVLLAWWREGALPFDRARQLVDAFARVRAKDAAPLLVAALADVRLRPLASRALGDIGEKGARPALASRFASERFTSARGPLGDAVVRLGGGAELAAPLARFLGVPDPLPGGLALARRAKILDLVGGPDAAALAALAAGAQDGAVAVVRVPPGAAGADLRAVVRVRSRDGRPGELRIGGDAPAPSPPSRATRTVPPEFDAARTAIVPVPATAEHLELFATLPGARAVGGALAVRVRTSANVELDALAVVPLADELPPPAPEPWTGSADADEDADEVRGDAGVPPR
jgi:hypothetical protein